MKRTLQGGNARAATLAVVLALGSSAALGAAPHPKDVHVVDVTPRAFTVAWVVDEASVGTLEVYTDVLGTTAASGAAIEPSWVASGDLALAGMAEDLGVVRVRVSGLDPATPYFFRTSTTPKAGGAAALHPASGALYAVRTADASFPVEANGLALELVDADGVTPRPGALLLVELPGSVAPLSAIAGDGFSGALAGVDLANLSDGSASLTVVGGEPVVITALAGSGLVGAGVRLLAANDGHGVLQREAVALALLPVVDTDGDGISDDAEVAAMLDPGNPADGALDADGDGVSNVDEHRLGTGIQSADSDGDGLTDGEEVNVHGTMPTDPDTDRDGRSDGDEVNGVPATDPLDADSDDDGVNDGVEVGAGTDPNNPAEFPILDGDTDGVGDLVDNCPVVPNPTQLDTDLDGLGDACDGDDDADGLGDGPDNCPLDANPGQEDDDADGVGNLCDNCPADANTPQRDNEGDGLGDVCDPDDDNDGVDDFQAPPAPSDVPFELTGVNGVSNTTLPVVGNDSAFVGIEKFIVAESRAISLGFYDLKNRVFTPATVPPADQGLVGWLALGLDTNGCGCFAVVEGDSITIDTDMGSVTAVFDAGIQAIPNLLFVSDDGSTWLQYFVPNGPLATLSQSSQVAGPLDNCPFVANPLQEDTDGDGIGDLCDITADDLDGDSVLNVADNCPNTHNPGQEDFDLDGVGDACDPDDDGDGVSDADESGTLLTDPYNVDTDGDGILDGDEDFDYDGKSNADELAGGTSPFDPQVDLTAGLNYFAYPVTVPPGLTAFALLPVLGDDTEVARIRRLDALTQQFEEAAWIGGVPQGSDFTIDAAEGYLVDMLVDKQLTFSGDKVCPSNDLVVGRNLIAFPCFPGGFNTTDLLLHFGAPDQVATVQTFDPRTGRFATRAWSGGFAVGEETSVAAGQAIFVNSRSVFSGVASPLSPPTVQIVDPADMAVLDTTPYLVTGTVSPPDAVVTVNGVVATLDGLGGFSASVDLAEGANTLTAVARTTDNLSSTDAIDVTLDTSVPVDYTLNRPDSVADSRMFNVGPGALTGVAYFQVQLANLPAGVSYAPGSISFNNSTGDVTAPFTISTSASATVGVHMFQATYIFFDGGDVELTRHTLDFTIEVLP